MAIVDAIHGASRLRIAALFLIASAVLAQSNLQRITTIRRSTSNPAELRIEATNGTYAGFKARAAFTGSPMWLLPAADAVGCWKSDGSLGLSIAPCDSHWSRSGGMVYPATLADKVGIGTNTPGQSLDVVGVIRATTGIEASDLTTSYLKARKIEVQDPLGTSLWDIQANQSPILANLTVRDGGGASIMELRRVFAGATVNEGLMALNWHPTIGSSTGSTYFSLGKSGKEWDATLHDVTITGTCSGCGGGGLLTDGGSTIYPTNTSRSFAIGSSSTSRKFQVFGDAEVNTDLHVGGVVYTNGITSESGTTTTWYTNQAFAANAAFNVGSDAVRAATLYTYNLEAIPAGGIPGASYVKTRKYEIVDAGGLSSWDMQANASAISSQVYWRNNAGTVVMALVNVESSSVVDEGRVALNWHPTIGSSTGTYRSLGKSGKEWDAVLHNVNITGTCTVGGSPCAGAASLFTDGGVTTYLTSTIDNLCLGCTSTTYKLDVSGAGRFNHLYAYTGIETYQGIGSTVPLLTVTTTGMALKDSFGASTFVVSGATGNVLTFGTIDALGVVTSGSGFKSGAVLGITGTYTDTTSGCQLSIAGGIITGKTC